MRRRNPQVISSAATSLKQVPMLHKAVAAQLGPVNADVGGGRFDLASEFLAKSGVLSLVYDPYNRTQAHNDAVLDQIKAAGGADTATVSNVLNVIAEAGSRSQVITLAKGLLKRGGTAFFSVYEGDKKDQTGGSRQTAKDSWQNFWPTSAYLPEVQRAFPRAFLRGKVIVAPT